jgi:hypothetical protein
MMHVVAAKSRQQLEVLLNELVANGWVIKFITEHSVCRFTVIAEKP